MASELLTAMQVANRLGVTPTTVRRWITTGKLKGIRLGGVWPDSKLLRIDADELERALDRWGGAVPE